MVREKERAEKAATRAAKITVQNTKKASQKATQKLKVLSVKLRKLPYQVTSVKNGCVELAILQKFKRCHLQHYPKENT